MLDGLLAAEVREVPVGVAAGRVAECLPAGPGLAGWLAAADPGGLEDGALAGVAASWRRLASWAQAGELAAVAQIASRSAARDPEVTVGADGRPGRVPDDAAAEVSLGLVMSRCTAEWWLDLAVTLRWRLAGTGGALAAGVIDLGRARLIAEATSVLAEQDARTVEAQVLPRAGELTSAGLRAALRRAVIAVDPGGAERRRQQSEARAKLCLYPDEDGTATLAGYQLPGIGAAAAMARVSALARALKASGAGGGIDLLRAQVYLGLLCGTLPLIPPADGAPPGNPPPPTTTTRPPATHPPPGDDAPPGDSTAPPGPPPPGDGAPGDSPGPHPGHGRGPRPGHGPGPRPADRPGNGPPRGSRTPGSRPPGSRPPGGPPGGGIPGGGPPGGGLPGEDLPAEDVPPPAGPPEDLPPDDPDPGPGPGPGYDPDDDPAGDWRAGQHPIPDWPPLPDRLPAPPRPAPGHDSRPPPARAGAGRPPPGLLDLTLPWTTLAGLTRHPGHLGRLGPITPAQACQLAAHAATRPGTDWRIILTDPAGHALAITRIPRTRTTPARGGPGRQPARPGRRRDPAGQPDHPHHPPAHPGHHPRPPPRRHRDPRPRPGRRRHRRHPARRPRRRRHRRRRLRPHHRHPQLPPPAPPARLHHRPRPHLPPAHLPPARLAHRPGPHPPLRPGGPTCRCNLGGFCRHDHILKHTPGWHVTQPAPGTFHWTTPTGRTYLTAPDTHPL